ncbi:Flp pilus assembly protein CpaB [Paraburkholderia bonniea]|uniref:Flp pilus assembly protein CpaB n=1 Tax=Paraburkholderia bonniea TaxID=2152891 RepID=UPI00129285ED|nr:Flp pilus assembly protein CpaB [Paraburkholderia bonniea]WJF91282.1 Flp pilus assembly protein CpaB [Paraburkholderia bonniea]WJF94597.1 Flp pilus assembly protein CpaB [Paraburkholderia bonniea]
MPHLTRIVAGVLIVLALLLGLVAWMLARRPAPPVAAPALAQVTFPVVLTTRPLPAGKPITLDALRVQPLPVHPDGAFADAAALVGRVPVADIGAAAPVFEVQLSSGLAEDIQPGQRAIAVRVDETNAVGNRVRPGDVVDVFFTLKREPGAGVTGGAEVDQTQARLLLSKIQVLTFGNTTVTGSTTPEQNEPNAMARTAVLAVPMSEITRLALAEANGRLLLALRNPKDEDVVDPRAFAALPGVLKTTGQGALQDVSTQAAAGVALDALAGGAHPGSSVTRAPRAPRAAGGIEVIRAGRAETVAW